MSNNNYAKPAGADFAAQGDRNVQEDLIHLAFEDIAVVTIVLANRDKFSNDYHYIFDAMAYYASLSPPALLTLFNFQSWMDIQDGMIPAIRSGNMTIHNRCHVRIVKSESQAGLLLALDDIAARNKREVLINGLRRGDQSAIKQLEAMGEDVAKINAPFIAQRLAGKEYAPNDIGN